MLFITVCNNAVSIFHHLSFVFILVWKINKKSIQFCQRHYYANEVTFSMLVQLYRVQLYRVQKFYSSNFFVPGTIVPGTKILLE